MARDFPVSAPQFRKHFRRLLERTTDEAERHRILELLAEGVAKMQIAAETPQNVWAAI